MRKYTFISLLIALVGCTTDPVQYGNFVQNEASSYTKKMAEDVLKQILKQYPPARTRFDLQHITPDAFGTHLKESMRTQGYAVLEYKQEPTRKPQASTAPGLLLSYIVDEIEFIRLYRVTLHINHTSISRAYQVIDGSLEPAGAWVRKE